MLILTPTPLQTAAERAFFAELAGWDTGSGVRGAVVASLPVVEGPMERRQADAVLFVPEGVAVVRVVEVQRNSGVVTARADGAWTIGPDDGPGDVLQLDGGGSTPLEGLMSAGMHAAVTLRKAGLEPGRIARLTVLTGPVTGLVPADGDLGEGDQIALVDPRSLLLGVARAARYAGTDNPRLWTTADVRAAVEALGVAGRTPTVEELNGEGFPYSPYVLRRPDLLTPAALNASPSRVAAAPLTGAGVQRVVPPGPLVDPAAAARVAAAAVQAQEEAERAAPEPAAPAAAAPAPAPAARPAAPTYQPTVPVELRPTRSGDTLALTGEPATAVAGGPGVVEPRPAAEDTGGIGGLFGDGGTVAVTPSRPPRELPPELRPRPLVGGPPPTGGSSAADTGTPDRRRTLAVVAAAVVLLLVVAGVGFWALGSGGQDSRADEPAATTSAAAPTTAPAGPAVGATEVVNGTTFTLRAVEVDDTCRGHAYDAVAAFFASSDCAGLTRSLWSADAGGQPAVVSLSRVTMPDVANAQALRSLADTDGSGNVNDLLREGVRYDGGPEKLSRAEYASAQQDTTVTIVETSWTGPAGTASALDGLASSGLSLPDVGGSD
ncbi:conserved protein of unknown function [Modestobacter italicus]|uniref:NERD domain-containing protein n=1 Tax=Modestobacter italicus (strain DSM 44449 / CECT 9708 / BC 501) TaxID=2732864 RepID=I4EU32_MODI5|nr:hypothetical protein [Modestobacter marinus]CCH86895.1 conserved protein of unknown function [Modestobacter marinus]